MAKVFIGRYYNGEQAVAWTIAGLVSKSASEFEKIEVIDLPPISEIVLSYYEFRKLRRPNYLEAFIFLVSELGELADQIVARISAKWVRNNPDKERGTVNGILREAGDVLMMLTMTILKYGVDPLDAMIEKFKSKGWTQ